MESIHHILHATKPEVLDVSSSQCSVFPRLFFPEVIYFV